MNDTLTNTTEDYYRKVEDIYIISLEIYTALSLVCLAANVIIIFVIIKYKRLRLEKGNVIILNWALLNTFVMLTQPIIIRVSMYWYDTVNSTIVCILEQTDYTALLGDVFLIMLLYMYWFLKVYYPRKCNKFLKHINVALGSVYILCLFSFGVHIKMCLHNDNFVFAQLFLALIYLIFILYMIIMNITHLIMRRKLIQTTVISNIPLILSNTFLVSIFPVLITTLTYASIGIHPIHYIIIVFVCLILAMMNPIYFFVILYIFDNDYNTFFKHVLKCQCKKYENDEMDEEPVVYNSDVQIDKKNSPNMSYIKNSEAYKN